MRPVPRIVAVCQGGELDGLRFSIALAADGSPPELTVHGSESELVYVPGSELNLAVEHLWSLEAQRAGTEPHDVFDGFELFDPATEPVQGHHFVGVWVYREQL